VAARGNGDGNQSTTPGDGDDNLPPIVRTFYSLDFLAAVLQLCEL
jgi:hypothetical protein